MYQNHLDTIHGLLVQFCKVNKQYSWSVFNGKRAVAAIGSIEAYLQKSEPKTITYSITSFDSSQVLTVTIDNGIVINLKNGSYNMYGLYALVIDSLSSLKVPHSVVLLRRYWLLNLGVSLLAIPTLLLFLLHQKGWAVAWVLLMLFIVFIAAVAFFTPDSDGRSYADDFQWQSIVLSTNIKYGDYNSQLGTPVYTILTSTKTLISIFASLATIITFIFFVTQRSH